MGGTVSIRYIACTPVEEFPQKSVTIHVLTMLSTKGLQSESTTRSLNVTLGVEQSSSTSVGEPVDSGELSSSQLIVTSGGVTKVGGIASRTNIVWAQVLVLPQLSVAVHVLITGVSLEHPVPGGESRNVISTSESQLSVAVADPSVPGSVASLHDMVTSAGHEVISGGSVSIRMMVWTAEEELLQ